MRAILIETRDYQKETKDILGGAKSLHCAHCEHLPPDSSLRCIRTLHVTTQDIAQFEKTVLVEYDNPDEAPFILGVGFSIFFGYDILFIFL